MKPLTLRAPWALTLAAGGALACSAPVSATVLVWNNAAGGAASTASNWSPAQAPTAADDLTFNLAGAYTVSFSAAAASSRSMVYRQGSVTATIASPHTSNTGITIGDTNALTATLTLSTGRLNSAENVVMGVIAGSTGVLNVTDDSADFVLTGTTADMIVGSNGAATLNITGGGLVQVADQFIAANNATSAPTITISGAQAVSPFQRSRLNVAGVSQSRMGQGGDATVNISNGALASFAGDLVIANGSASTSTVTIGGGGGLGGIVDATLDVAGDLLIGRNSSAGSAAGAATVNINANGAVIAGGTLFLGGDSLGGSGTINMNGGILTASTLVESSGTIAGNGTLNGDVTMTAGTLSPSGTGFVFNGALHNTRNTGISGSRIHFGSTGSYVGSGVCATEITGDPNGLIQATGNLSIGRNTTSGFSYLGRIAAGSSIITLVDSNGAVLGGQTDLGSGRVICSTGIGNQNGARIFGRGTLVGNVINSGIIDPEQPDDTSGATLSIQGNLSCNPTSILDFEIGGNPGDAANDRIDVTGTATFGGTVRVRFRPGFEPRPGQQFILCNAGLGRSGEFAIDDIPGTPCPPAYRPVIVYSSTAAILLITNAFCQRLDFNCDGDVNPDDLGDYINCFFATPPCPSVDYINNDGDINPDDLGDFINVFFGDCN